MNETECPIAILRGVDHHAETKNVGKLLEGKALGFHLAENRPRLLLAALHTGLDAMLLENLGQVLFDLLQQAAVLFQKLGQAIRHGAPCIRINIAEGQLFELFPHILHTHAASKRRIDIHRFFGNTQALVFPHHAQRAHVVQAIRKLHQKHADIF